MSWSDETIDALIRARLDQQAESVDPRPHYERIQNQRMPTPSQPIPVTQRLPIAWRWVLAASLLIAVAVALQWRPADIAAESIVRDAQVAHRMPLDRCYLVEIKRELGAPAFPGRPESTVRLWTRGDRFWLESTQGVLRWTWGRDEQGGVWMAPFGGRVGLKLDVDEVPPFLALHADFNSLQLDTLLDEVLHDFNLVRSPPEPGETGTSYRIVAEPRHAYTPQLIRRVVLEIDNESHVVRKAIIARGTPRTLFATTTYTLVDSQVQDDETYHLNGHLKVTAEVYTRDHHPERRNELMGRFFGPGVEKRMRPPIPKP